MIKLPEDVKYIIEKLGVYGYHGYIVGGCVRDSLMGREPNDWDITTDAQPEDVIKVFGSANVLPTGIKHGTVIILLNGCHYEVTTFRTEGKYSDFRRPDHVDFTSFIEDDLKRRDFTINAMAYSEDEGLIDIFGGMDDISNTIIRCVGCPDERFNEDALRMLRAVRFSSQLGFTIEECTFDSICRNSMLLQHVSMERIRDEFSKIIISDNLINIINLLSTKLMKYIIPEFYNAYHDGSLSNSNLNDIVKMLETSKRDCSIRLAVMIHKVAKIKYYKGEKCLNPGDSEYSKQTEIILGRLKYERGTIERVKTMVMYYDLDISTDRQEILRLLKKIGEQNFRDILKIKILAAKFTGPKQVKILEDICCIFEDILESGQCFSRKQLAVDGEDLKGIGVPQGKYMGKVMEYLVDMVIKNPELNNKDILIRFLKSKEQL